MRICRSLGLNLNCRVSHLNFNFKVIWKLFIYFIFLLSGRLALAQGGPPLLTDDPGTPGDGHWEINIAADWTHGRDLNFVSAPYVDANYGWGEAVQLKAEGGLVSGVQGFGPTSAGGTPLLTGVKWRFYDDERSGLSISTYPQVQFHTFFTGSKEKFVEPGTLYILPIEISRTLGQWSINPEVGWIYSTENKETVFYGLAAGYTVAEFREILVELYSQKQVYPEVEKLLLFNVGTRWLLINGLSFIASTGHTFQTFTGDQPQYLAYIGLQLRY